jgi:arsenate reductase-like glutaredoxin family protein
MDANVVHIVAKQLSNEQLEQLYHLIGIDLNKIASKKKPKKKPLITDEEIDQYLFKNIFNIKS